MSPTLLDRYMGCCLGLSTADSVGRVVEFASLAEIRRRFGPDGIQDLPEEARYTDDTCMSIAVAEALLDAQATDDVEVVMSHVVRRFVEWSKSDQTGRAPGNTCLAGCRALRAGRPWRESGVKRSKGCGSAMRVAPIGLIYADHDLLREVSQAQAVCTHGHPAALAGAHAAALVVRLLLEGVDPDDLLARLTEETTGTSGDWDQLLSAVPIALDATRHGEAEPQEVLQTGQEDWRLGLGWVADEAVASALFCFLLAHERGGGFVEAVRFAANTAGDSDSLATIAGSFAGTYWGVEAIPADWRKRIERSEYLHRLGERLFTAAKEKTA